MSSPDNSMQEPRESTKSSKFGCILLVFLFVGLALVSRWYGNQPAPPRDFTSEDLLLTQEMVPAGWERTQVDHVSIAKDGFGNAELDRWVGFVWPDDPQNRVFSNHFVLRFRNEEKAASWYRSGFSPWFDENNQVVNRSTSDQRDPTESFQFADQYNITCEVTDASDGRKSCAFKGQYAEFVILFHSVIRPHTTTIAGFNDLVEQIDDIMAQHLQEQ